MEGPRLPSPIVQLESTLLQKHGIELFVKRDDLIHEVIMGNKWRKLKYNLEEAKRLSATRLLTFGGAYSNHLVAVAAAARLAGFESEAIVRGDELHPDSNPTLRYAHGQGMKMTFVDRSTYRSYRQDFESPDRATYVIPEGGTNTFASRGVAELIEEIDIDYDVIVTPIGTGGTMAGIMQGLGGEKQVVGISSLKGKFITTELKKLLEKMDVPFHNYEILTDYHFGGYGRITQELIGFINTFRRDFGFLLDPVYTGKMFFGVLDRVAKGAFSKGTRIIVIHTGGLQGIEGYNARFGRLIQDT